MSLKALAAFKINLRLLMWTCNAQLAVEPSYGLWLTRDSLEE